jgi:hypothetical protein
MTSGNPPRRSKKPDGPQTIDLEAEHVDPVPEGVATPVQEGVEPTAATAEAPSAAETGAPAKAESADQPRQPSAEKHEPTPKSSGGSGGMGALAAGIVGGLIVLAGAGSAQYAGLIPNFGPTAEMPDYSGQISELQKKLDAVAIKADNPPKTDLTPLENQIKSINDAMAKLPVGDLTDVLAIKGKLDETAASTAKVEAQLASIANRLQQAEAKINEPRDDVDVARAIASASLKAAIDRGGPFTAELNTLKSVAKDDTAVAGLQPYAAKGVPSRSELIKSYPDTADAMLAVLNKPIPGQSLSERLFKSAFSVIKVRPVGDVEGDSPQAVVARIGDKLQNGDLKSAAKEWNALPDDMKAAGKDFKTALDARIAVEDLVGSTLANAVSGTAKQN